jgi:Adenylate cyclase, family 3 (some proteins contain HAMP domain)
VTVIFADLRGFANFAEKHPAENVVTVLNQFFKEMTRIIFQYRGTLDKFIGDAIMAYFGESYGLS